MKLSTLSSLSLLGLAAASKHEVKNHPRSSFCDKSALNKTVGTYTVSTNETISHISNTVNRGICDIARLNRMSDAMIPLNTGEELLIPPEICVPDNSTCLVTYNASATYGDCVSGGPHTYYTVKGDTLRYIALKLGITYDAILTTAQADTPRDTEVPAGIFIKIPLCSPSKCDVWPETFTYGTYKDIADRVGTTVGQLVAMNPSYNHTDVAKGEGAVIGVFSGCKNTSDKVTVIS
ncbi:hypothetical protein N7507_011765 [Penicillium longicatenatum]|nr:hypothetical protein N7507_011765 [Penicillium longicatenatum]